MSRVCVGLDKGDLIKLFNREDVECKFSISVDNVYSVIIQLDDESFGKKKTQADKIRSMSDEELAEHNVIYYCDSDCYLAYYECSDGTIYTCDVLDDSSMEQMLKVAISHELEWLQSEVEE